METAEINEIVKNVQNAIGPKLQNIDNKLESFRRSSAERYSSLESKINSLSCKEHDGAIRKIENDIIEIKSQIQSNKEHNGRQDKSRDKREGRLWGVLVVVIAGVILFYFQTHLMR